MKKYLVTINGKQKEVVLVSRTSSYVCFEIDGEEYRAEVSALELGQGSGFNEDIPVNSRLSKAQSHNPKITPGELRSPMPGLLLQVCVAENQKVALGQTAAVIEAMKMENNIPCPVSGLVNKIHVKPGKEVQQNELIISFSPE